MTEGGVTLSYVWDDRDRLVQVLEAGTELVSYAYDDDNIRVSTTAGGVTTSYLLDKNRPYAQVLEEYEDGSSVASYAYGLDLIEQDREGVESYYLVDGLGSTRVLLDEAGDVQAAYSYDAYGNLVGESGAVENAYRFAGEQWDEELGQYYLRQRYYDPATGRFTRRDTYVGRIEDPATLHKHIYAHADPVNGTDPSGLMTMTEIQAGFVHLAQSTIRSLSSISISPIAIDVVRAWAIVLSGGLIAPALLQEAHYLRGEVIEEQDSAGVLEGVKVLGSGTLEEERRVGRSNSNEERDLYQMRLQLQETSRNTWLSSTWCVNSIKTQAQNACYIRVLGF